MILSLKTASATTEVGLYDPANLQTPVASIQWESGRALADELLTKLVEFLGHRPVPQQTLTGVIVFSGPGSFTSLRIGHTVANALASSLGIPVVGAQGDNWIQVAHAALAHTKLDVPAIPHYGSEANITRPKT